MQLRLIEAPATTGSPPVKKAKRRSVGGRTEETKTDVPVSGPVDCDRTYGLVVAKCRLLTEDGALCVRHAAENEVSNGNSKQRVHNKIADKKAHKGADRRSKEDENEYEEDEEGQSKRGKRGRAKPSRKKDDSAGDDEEEDEEQMVVSEGEEGNGEEEGNQTKIYFVWQLWANREEGEEKGAKRKKSDDTDQPRGKRRRGDDLEPRGRKAKVVIIDDEEDESAAKEMESDDESTVTLEPLPAEASQLKLISHDRTKGEVRFEITFSSSFFSTRPSSALTRLTFASSVRAGATPTIPLPSTASHSNDDDGEQSNAYLPLLLKSPVRSGVDAAPSSSALPPILLPPPPSSSMPALPSTLLPPRAGLHSSPPTTLPPLQPDGRIGPTAVGEDAWADFASKVKAATLQSLKKGKDKPETGAETKQPATASDTRSPGDPASERSGNKRKSRPDEEILIESYDDADSPAHAETARGALSSSSAAKALAQAWNLKQAASSRDSSPPQPERTTSQEGLRKWYDEQNVRTKSSEILQFLQQAIKRVDPKFLERFTTLHNKLQPVLEQFSHPDTQHTLILVLLHALTLTGYCVDLLRFCYWVKEFAALSVDKVVDQITELSSQLVQLQFQKDVEEKLHGCLTTLLITLTSLTEIISGPVYENYQPEREASDKARGKKFISLAKGNAVPWIKEWLKTSYTEVQGQSVAKKMVYKDYLAYCNRVGIEPTTSSVLGKIFREVFPFVSTRRLGSRNNNITYYSNIGPTANLLAHSSSSAQASATASSSASTSSSSSSASSPPVQEMVISPSSPPATRSRSRSSSLNSRNPSPPSKEPSAPSSASSASTASSSSGGSGERPTYHMGSFRSYSPSSSFSYYPSPSYYSSSTSASSSSGSRHTAPSSSSSSSSGASSAAKQQSTSASSSTSGTVRSNSPTPTAAFIPQPPASTDLASYSLQGSSGQFPLVGSNGSAAAALPHYFHLPPPPMATSSASASSQSSSAAPAAAPLPAAPSHAAYPPAMLLPAALSILASFPHLAYASGLYPPAAAPGLPSAYPAYPYAGFPYPYPFPPDQQPTAADAAAAAAVIAQMQLPADPTAAAALLSQFPGLAAVKREQRDDAEQQAKEGEGQDATRSARRDRNGTEEA